MDDNLTTGSDETIKDDTLNVKKEVEVLDNGPNDVKSDVDKPAEDAVLQPTANVENSEIVQENSTLSTPLLDSINSIPKSVELITSVEPSSLEKLTEGNQSTSEDTDNINVTDKLLDNDVGEKITEVDNNLCETPEEEGYKNPCEGVAEDSDKNLCERSDDNIREKLPEQIVNNIPNKTAKDVNEVENIHCINILNSNLDLSSEANQTKNEQHEISSNSIENKVAALEQSTEEGISEKVGDHPTPRVTNNVEDNQTTSKPVKEGTSIESVSETQPSTSEDDLQKKLLKLPPHLMGHNLDKPVDPIKNGRVSFTPRLGVKVPYKNLTSQIVSKQEITDEIMERSRQRQAAAEHTENAIFTKNLTKRLAEKLSSGGKALPVTEAATTPITSEATSSSPLPSTDVHSERIVNNSDLIALLEGDDDSEWNEIGNKKSRNAEWERETALKQLAELPKLGRKDVDEEPRFLINSVTKTYTRKRKPSEDIKAILEAAKKPIISPQSTKTPVQTPNKALTNSKSSTPKTLVNSSKTPLHQKVDEVLPSPQKTPTFQKLLPKTISAAKLKIVEDRKSSKQSLIPSLVKLKSSELKSSSITNEKSVVSKNINVGDKTPGQQPSQGYKPPSSNQDTVTEQKPVATPKTPTKPTKTLSIQKSIQNIRNLSTQSSPTTPTLPQNTKLSTDKKAIIILANTPEDEQPDSPSQIVNNKHSLLPNTYISKSSRVVKRKKIWDPDEITPTKMSKTPTSVEPLTENKVTPTQKAIIVKHEDNSVEKQTAKKIIKKVLVKKQKKGKPKRLSEIDRLLMDEGAVNLLYSVKNTEPTKKKNKSFFSIDKAERDLMNKTNELKNELLQNNRVTKDTPIALRKKAVTPKATFKDPAAVVLHRKKSKDSTEGSVHIHTPPASPAYTFHENVSRIIRRHSSSSFTSKESDEECTEESASSHKKSKSEKKRKISTATAPEDNKTSNEIVIDNAKYSEFKMFNIRNFENLVQIILVPIAPNVHVIFTLQLLSELTAILNLLQLDNDCRVVVITSASNSFCLGIDYKELVAPNIKERKTIAKEYATSVREFLLAVAKFSKLLVAGVHGNSAGLAVTMLPLFDMVLASDTATFSTPYTRLGCAAEGGALLKLPHVMHNALASELFFASRKLTAAEALRLGLVTRTLWPDKFQDELISSLKVISTQSLQSMEAIKLQLRHQLLANVESSLKSETSTLIQHWASNECQSNFVNYSFESK